MMELAVAPRKGTTTGVCLAAVLEVVFARLLSETGAVAERNHKIRITPRHLKIAILESMDFSTLFRGVVLAGGVLPPQ
jgi:hypothetical protein